MPKQRFRNYTEEHIFKLIWEKFSDDGLRADVAYLLDRLYHCPSEIAEDEDKKDDPELLKEIEKSVKINEKLENIYDVFFETIEFYQKSGVDVPTPDYEYFKEENLIGFNSAIESGKTYVEVAKTCLKDLNEIHQFFGGTKLFSSGGNELMGNIVKDLESHIEQSGVLKWFDLYQKQLIGGWEQKR